jgi:hypothetical protein
VIQIYDDSDVNDGWTNDDLRNLEQFLGDTGLTFTPSDPTGTGCGISQLTDTLTMNAKMGPRLR